jgi:hypothetical protein
MMTHKSQARQMSKMEQEETRWEKINESIKLNNAS